MNEVIYEEIGDVIGQLRYTKGLISDLKDANTQREVDHVTTDLELSLENCVRELTDIEKKVGDSIE